MTKKHYNSGKNNPNYGKKGLNSSRYIDGRTIIKHYCLDCKKRISYNSWKYGSKMCHSCSALHNPKQFHGIGKQNGRYINGISKLPYPIEFNDSLKESIRKRDNYKCQNCGMTEEEQIEKIGRILHVHHIDYNKNNCKKSNLITTCNNCNLKANSNRDYWYAYYTYKIGGDIL
jgi:ribosomal protein L37AE/L43A